MTEDQIRIFKITTAGLWERADATGIVPKSPVDRADGYMHFSTAAQLAETLRLHFAGLRDLVVLEVKARALGAALKWEPSRGGDLFPHLYAELPVAAVEKAYGGIAVADDGALILPEGLSTPGGPA